MTFFERAGAACALIALAFAAPASATCWLDADRDAATARELQTMLMVATLRCHAAGIDISADYNGFVNASHELIELANQRIKRHFAEAGGAQADYDRFTTLLANAYGAEPTDTASCAEAAGSARQAAASPAEFRRIAANRVFPRALPGGACSAPPRPVQVATIAASVAPIVTPDYVRLPDDVTAALAVLARYRASADPAPAPKLAAVDAPTLLAQLPETIAR